MPYRITFYGERTAEIIPDGPGQQMYQDFQTNELPDRVEVRQGLTVERRTIREIEYVKGERQRVELSRAQIELFERDKLQPHLNSQGDLSKLAEAQFLQHEGVIQIEAGANEGDCASGRGWMVVSHKIEQFQRLQEQISQWRFARGRRRFAEKKKMEHYQQLANEHER